MLALAAHNAVWPPVAPPRGLQGFRCAVDAEYCVVITCAVHAAMLCYAVLCCAVMSDVQMLL